MVAKNKAKFSETPGAKYNSNHTQIKTNIYFFKQKEKHKQKTETKEKTNRRKYGTIYESSVFQEMIWDRYDLIEMV